MRQLESPQVGLRTWMAQEVDTHQRRKAQTISEEEVLAVETERGCLDSSVG